MLLKTTYIVIGDQIWYSTPSQACKPYLRCLLTFEDLHEKFGIEFIPLGCAADVYEKLLIGEKYTPKLALADRKLPALMDADTEEGGIGGVQVPSLEHDMEDSGDDEASDDPHDAPPPPSPVVAAVAAGSSASRVPPASAAPAGLEGFTWGIFTFGVKHPSATAPLGGYEARCKFHARSKTAGCKKFIRIESPDESGRAQARLRAKWWCSQARDHTRQWTHLRHADVWSPPAEDELEAMIIWDEPAEPVVNDADFYASQQTGQAKKRRIRGKKGANPSDSAGHGAAGRAGVGSAGSAGNSGAADNVAASAGEIDAASDPSAAGLDAASGAGSNTAAADTGTSSSDSDASANSSSSSSSSSDGD